MKRTTCAILAVLTTISLRETKAADHGMQIQMLESEIVKLTTEKQQKYAELEKCAGSVKGFKIAGISLIGLTAVGVAYNIHQHSVSKGLDGQIVAAEQAKAERAKEDRRRQVAQQQSQSSQDYVTIEETPIPASGIPNNIDGYRGDLEIYEDEVGEVKDKCISCGGEFSRNGNSFECVFKNPETITQGCEEYFNPEIKVNTGAVMSVYGKVIYENKTKIEIRCTDCGGGEKVLTAEVIKQGCTGAGGIFSESTVGRYLNCTFAGQYENAELCRIKCRGLLTTNFFLASWERGENHEGGCFCSYDTQR